MTLEAPQDRNDLPHETVVQSRRGPGLFFLFGSAFFGVGILAMLDRGSGTFLIIMSILSGVLMIVCALFAFQILVLGWPKAILNSEGLIYRNIFWSSRLRWSDMGPLEVNYRKEKFLNRSKLYGFSRKTLRALKMCRQSREPIPLNSDVQIDISTLRIAKTEEGAVAFAELVNSYREKYGQDVPAYKEMSLEEAQKLCKKINNVYLKIGLIFALLPISGIALLVLSAYVDYLRQIQY